MNESDKKSQRVQRELRTLECMVTLYCRQQHADPNGCCGDCRTFLAYARERLERCPFLPRKPACADCVVHCYRGDMRERAKTIMRYAGPRILWHHPWLALGHLLDRVRYAPNQKRVPSEKAY